MSILLLGHGQHGKSTVAHMLFQQYHLISRDSSFASAEIFLYDMLKNKYGYNTLQECYKDRVNHRQEWYDLIYAYNTPKTRLATEIFSNSDIYVGMRSNDELQACLKEGIINLIIGVYDYKKELESSESFDINIWEVCDFIIPNSGTKDELKERVRKLEPLLFIKKFPS